MNKRRKKHFIECLPSQDISHVEIDYHSIFIDIIIIDLSQRSNMEEAVVDGLCQSPS